MRAQYNTTCSICTTGILIGDEIIKDWQTSGYAHATCVSARLRNEHDAAEAAEREQTELESATTQHTQTLDEHYNALCQSIDRIMTGNPKVIALGGARSSLAVTLREETGELLASDERAVVRFDHKAIRNWSRNGWDRTALTLALNIHELGHMHHSPAIRGQFPKSVQFMQNILEDQRQEILTGLMYPRAVDYLRFLNVRGLQLAVKQGFLARSFMLQYGRRHLYPPSINNMIEQAALEKYGASYLQEIKNIIDEYLRLALPEKSARAWQLAEQLERIDRQFDPPYKNKPLEYGDPRHDCGRGGVPTLSKEERDKLSDKIRKLVKQPTRTKEPKHKEPESGEKGDSQEGEAQPADGGEPTPGERESQQESQAGKRGGETPDKPGDREPASERSSETPDLAEPSGAGKDEEEENPALDQENEEPWEDPGDLADIEDDETRAPDTEDTEDTELSNPTPSKAEDNKEASEDEAKDEPSSSNSAENDSEPVVEAEIDSEPEHQPGGKGSSPRQDIEDAIKEILQDLENEAIEQVHNEVDRRHIALKSSELMPSLGGNKRGALNPIYRDAARRTARLFEDINQDLKAETKRDQRRGRLDKRRIPSAIHSGNTRVFKRRLKDLSSEAALAVYILIDTSSSMSDPADLLAPASYRYRGTTTSKIEVALPAGLVLAKAIENAGHVAKVVTFSDGDTTQKNWLDEFYRAERLAQGGTDPRTALRKAIPDFVYVERELGIHNHVLIMITDGDLNGDAIDPCKELLATLVSMGVFVIEIGIGIAPTPIHGAWKIMTIPSVMGITKAMSKPLAELAREIAKSVRRKIA